MNFLFFAFGILSAVVIILLIVAVVLIVKVNKTTKALADQRSLIKDMETNSISYIDNVYRDLESKERDMTQLVKDSCGDVLKEGRSYTDSRVDKFLSGTLIGTAK